MRALWRLLGYARPYWRDVVTVLAAMTASVFLDVLRPWPMKLLVDQVLGGQPATGGAPAILPGADRPEGLLVWVAVATLVIFLAGTLVDTLQTIIGVRFGQRMVYDLAADLFLHLQRLSLLFHSHRPVGDSIARVTADPYGANLLVNSALLPLLHAL